MGKAKWPTRWLMTDERMGAALWPALDRLPEGCGVVVRHYDTLDRPALARKVASVAARRQLVMALAGDVELARSVGAVMVHNPASDAGEMAVSRSVHSIGEAELVNRSGASLAFVSPVFPTRSHPDETPLSREDAGKVVAMLSCPAIALGGVDARRFATLDGLGFYGWAGIDAWIRT